MALSRCPTNFHEKWIVRISDLDTEPEFKDLVKFIDQRVKLLSHPQYGIERMIA